MTDREYTARYKLVGTKGFTAVLCAHGHLTLPVSDADHIRLLHRLFLNRSTRLGIVFG